MSIEQVRYILQNSAAIPVPNVPAPASAWGRANTPALEKLKNPPDLEPMPPFLQEPALIDLPGLWSGEAPDDLFNDDQQADVGCYTLWQGMTEVGKLFVVAGATRASKTEHWAFYEEFNDWSSASTVTLTFEIDSCSGCCSDLTACMKNVSKTVSRYIVATCEDKDLGDKMDVIEIDSREQLEGHYLLKQGINGQPDQAAGELLVTTFSDGISEKKIERWLLFTAFIAPAMNNDTVVWKFEKKVYAMNQPPTTPSSFVEDSKKRGNCRFIVATCETRAPSSLLGP